MALKDKAGLLALVAGVLTFIGWCTPYIWVSSGMGIDGMLWSWGLVSVLGITLFVASDILIAGVLIIISAIILLATGALARKREELKTMGYVWIVAAIIGLIGVFVPLAMIGTTIGLSIGFYLPLIGAIVGLIAGALAAFVK